jgi:hypothetical protein
MYSNDSALSCIARIHNVDCLRELMDQADFEKVLKKHLSSTTLRNMEKILDQVRNGTSQSGKSSSRSRNSRLTL